MELVHLWLKELSESNEKRSIRSYDISEIHVVKGMVANLSGYNQIQILPEEEWLKDLKS